MALSPDVRGSLTVVIPSYNRNDYVNRLLEGLLPLMPPETPLIIIDNHSDVPVAETAAAVISRSEKQNIGFVRHEVNVGGNENLLRCFEYCKTDWLWIIGDDDSIFPGSFDRVFDDIDRYPDAVNLHYKWKDAFHRKVTKSYGKGFRQFVSEIAGLGDVLFISSNIYNVPKLREFLHAGHFLQTSCAPHLSCVLLALEKYDHRYFLSDDSIVENGEECIERRLKWDQVAFMRYFKYIIDVPAKPENQELLFEVYDRIFTFRHILFQLLSQYDVHKDRNILLRDYKSTMVYKVFYGGLGANFKYRVIYCMLRWFPGFTSKLRKSGS